MNKKKIYTDLNKHNIALQMSYYYCKNTQKQSTSNAKTEPYTEHDALTQNIGASPPPLAERATR